MTKKAMRITAAVMTAAAVCFIVYALSHPGASFPWSNGLTFALYGVYAAAVTVLFIAPGGRKK